MTANFLKLMKITEPQISEAQRTPSKIDTKKNLFLKHIIIKLQKIKDKGKILKETRKKKKLPIENKAKNYIQIPRNKQEVK